MEYSRQRIFLVRGVWNRRLIHRKIIHWTWWRIQSRSRCWAGGGKDVALFYNIIIWNQSIKINFVQSVLPFSLNLYCTMLRYWDAVHSGFPRHVHYFPLDSNFSPGGKKKNYKINFSQNSSHWHTKVFKKQLLHRLMADSVQLFGTYIVLLTQENTLLIVSLFS